MGRINCTQCGGSGREYLPQNESCSGCNGTGKAYGYGQLCTRCNGSGSVSVTKGVACRVCGGSGGRYVSDPPAASPARSSSKSSSKTSKAKSNSSSNNQSSSAQGFVGLIGFIAGAYIAYDLSNEDLIITGIAGLVTSYLGYRFYKAIILIAIIIGGVYLWSQSQ